MKDDDKAIMQTMKTETTKARWTRGLAGVMLVAVISVLATPALSGQSGQASQAPAQAGEDEYRIGTEDQLEVVFLENATLTRNVRVRPDGRISLPIVNDLRAAGLTPMQLRDLIRKRYAEYMREGTVPDVTVIVAQVHASRASVLGQVNNPGRFELGQRTTVLDALAMAGGFNTFAKRDKVVVHRRDGATILFNFDRAVDSQDFKGNVVLVAGDIIIVP